MAQPSARTSDQHTLDELVHQFADPMAFLRELVQNAVDAGTDQVEVRVEFEPDGGPRAQRGALVIAVEDWGEGMDRTIIETRLTRLFASSKADDRTKVGKFGIGFVSVFALEPDLVCVDTARGGTAHRIVFDRDRTFRILELAEPREGTLIRVFRRGRRDELEPLIDRVRQTLRRWCRHLTIDLRLFDEPITEPFALGVPIELFHEAGDLRVAVGHPLDGIGEHGFYGRGLTLVESRDGDPTRAEFEKLPELVGLSFKVSSPHLSHTLTRDRIIHDAHFERVIDELLRLARGPLVERVIAALTAQLAAIEAARATFSAAEPAERPNLRYARRALAWHLRRDHLDARAQAAASLALGLDGERLSLAELGRRAKGRTIWRSDRADALAEAVAREGELVVVEPDSWGLDEPLAARGLAVRAIAGAFVLPVALEPGRDQGARALLAAIAALRTASDAPPLELTPARFMGNVDHVALVDAPLGQAARVERAVERGRGWFARRSRLTLDLSSELLAPLAELALSEPELAALLAWLALEPGLAAPAKWSELARSTTEARCRRLAR